MHLTLHQISEFQRTIYDYYLNNKRIFLWRNNTNSYHVFVSEVMLQQTQTERVKTKFIEFITAFPSLDSLASASTFDVLKVWQGMGYNRRALMMQKSAATIVAQFGGELPQDPDILVTLPGIGKATAASIAAFAFNSPTVFVETNIRAVFIYFFFRNQTDITDAQILELVAQTLDKENPREWYYALMDYGVMLKAAGINPINKSKHYHKQSTFAGSDRQIRGAVLRYLLKNNKTKSPELLGTLARFYKTDEPRVEKIVEGLVAEGMVRKKNGAFFIEDTPQIKKHLWQ